MPLFLGIEIGGTKLQLGLGDDSGRLSKLWRADVDRAKGGEGIRSQILAAIPRLLAEAEVSHDQIQAIGIGFGGPIDDATGRTITSHQVAGWDDFPIVEWLKSETRLPIALGNDADVAALGEAVHGAGRGKSPVFYMTIGTGIGGGLVIDGKIYRGTGRGAIEIGHVFVPDHRPNVSQPMAKLEEIASGLALGRSATTYLHDNLDSHSTLRQLLADHGDVTGSDVTTAALNGDRFSQDWLTTTFASIADGLNIVITLFCPSIIVLGGGVSLTPERLFLDPIRKRVLETGFAAFRGETEIVTALLGEDVVIHGAIRMASTQEPDA